VATVIGGNGDTCILLLHGEGDDGSADIVDSAAGGLTKTVTPYEQARIATAAQKYGNSSIFCGSGASYVHVAASNDFRFSTLPFTVDFWANVSEPLRAYLFAWWVDDDNFFALERMTSNGTQQRFRLRFRQDGEDVFIAEGGAVTAFDGWRHVAATRSGDTTRLFIDGTLYASDVQASGDPYACNIQTWPLYIGGGTWMGQIGLHYLHGYIDEFRVLKAEAAWTASFTPYDNAYTPRFVQHDRGSHHLRASYVQHDRGLYGVARHPFAQHDRGIHHTYGAFEAHDRGAYHIYDSFVQHDRGVYGVARHPFVQHDRGGYRIRDSYTQHDRGGHGIASGSYTQHDRGGYIIRAGFTQSDRGTYNLRLQFEQHDRGEYRIADTTIEGYELFYAFDAEPDLTAAPWETFSSLPHESAAITGEGLHYFVLRERHRWNLCSQNITSWVVELDGADNEIMRAPSDPVAVQIRASANATALLRALYYYDEDTERQADQWLIYITDDGSDPDPDVDEPVVVNMVKADGIAKLRWASPAYDDLDTVKAIVRARRTSPLRDSGSTTIVSIIVTTQGPDSVGVGQFQQYGGAPKSV
jgi:hypothetical protein